MAAAARGRLRARQPGRPPRACSGWTTAATASRWACRDFEPARIPLRGLRRARDDYTLQSEGGAVAFGAVSMGNPHAVIEVDDVDTAPVEALGRWLQAQPAFPDSVNVGFAQVAARGPHPPARVRARRRRDAGLRQRRLRGRGGADAARARRRAASTVALPGGDACTSTGPTMTRRITMAGPAAFVFEGEWWRHERDSDEALGAHEVAAWLRRHPKFLQQFPDLALTLVVPRDEGPAASLASYQLEVLRDKNRELTRRLHELFANAQENERLAVRTHQLTLALMRQPSARRHACARWRPRWPRISTATSCASCCSTPVDGLDDADWLQVIARDDARLAPFRDCLGRRRAAVRPPAAGQARAAVRRPRAETCSPRRCCRCRASAWSRSAAAMPTASSPAWARCSCA